MLEESHEREITEFNQLWDQKFDEYKAACKQGEEALRQRQAETYASERERLAANLPAIPKHSSQILNLQKIQDAVIRQKEYKEAHTLQMQLDSLVENNQGRWQDDRNEKIDRMLGQLVKRHEVELKSYRAKAISGFNELKKQKAHELEALHKRYTNCRKELVGQQKLECSRLEMSMRVTNNLETVSKMMTSRSSVLERAASQASIEDF